MERNQFTFYRSFWNAAKSLTNRERLAFVDAVCAYVFENTTVELTGAASAVFTMALPVLETGKRKAMGGMRGVPGSKQSGKTLERSDKDAAKEKEKENEIENEIEIEDECPPPQPPLRGGARQGRGRTGNVFAELLREELS